MIEKVLNALLWLDSAFTRSRDPLLEEYRQYQRRILMSGTLALGFLILAVLVVPSEQATTELHRSLQAVAVLISKALLAVAVGAVFWLTVETYRLWRFFND